MDKVEAQKILRQALQRYQSMSYQQLRTLMGEPEVLTRRVDSGVEYQIEIEVFWDNPRQPGEELRVLGSIDDGGFRSSFLPLTADFIKKPDGTLDEAAN